MTEILRDEAVMKMIGELTTCLAHDLNNFLLPITTITQVVMDDLEEDSQAWRNLQKVLLAAEQGKELAAKFRAIRVMDSSNFESIDLKAAVTAACQTLDACLPENVALETGLRDVGTILGNDGQIQDMIMYLGLNAHEAIGDDDGSIEILLDPVKFDAISAVPGQILKPGEYAKLSIRDSGHGIRPSVMPRIFDPYFSTKPSGQGTGLSLTAVFGMVLSHRGDIRVISKPRDSTIFKLYFPTLEASAI